MEMIDAAGRIAAELFPDELKPEMLEALLAGKPVNAARRPSFDFPRRSDETGGPAPLADILIRPSTTIQTGMSARRDKLTMVGGEMRWFFSYLYQMPMDRVLGDALEDRTRYDVSISIPGANSIAFGRIESELLCAAFHVKVERETREAEVLILTAPNGKPAGVSGSDAGGPSSWNTGNRKLQMTNGGMADLARAIESVVQKPVMDETHLAGRYDLTLEYEDGERLLNAVRNLGLQIEPSRRPIEFLVVTKAQ